MTPDGEWQTIYADLLATTGPEVGEGVALRLAAEHTVDLLGCRIAPDSQVVIKGSEGAEPEPEM